MARLAASLMLALLACAPARAADRALIDLLGYSADGSTFAFEQFGIQDGSGLAFSSVYVVDLVNDTWTDGTPFTAQASDEAQPLADIRAEALHAAGGALEEYGIGVPVQVLALIGDGAADVSGRRLSWSTPSCCGPGSVADDSFALTLSATGDVSSSEPYCADMSPVGFRLAYQDGAGSRVLHEDHGTLPKSRGCTLDYRLYAVVQPYEASGGTGFVPRRVAIVATYPFGFEGVDRRFLAVPIDR